MIHHLLAEGYEVTGGVHGPGQTLGGGCRSVRLDVTDPEALSRVVAETSPDEVYHLAGLTRPGAGAVDEFYRVNFTGALNLLEAVREHAPGAAVLMVGSAYAYGGVDRMIPETEPLNPVNHYGVSKAAADLLAYSYAAEGLRVVRARPFNHSGPGQSPDFLLPSLVQQFVEIEAGRKEPTIRLGNLDSMRDFSDVRDIVRGYRISLQRGRNGEPYNLGSGRGTSVRELFELVRQEAGLKVGLEVEASRVRATDIPCLVADVGRARHELGWEAEIPLERTLRDMLNAARDGAVVEGGVGEA